MHPSLPLCLFFPPSVKEKSSEKGDFYNDSRAEFRVTQAKCVRNVDDSTHNEHLQVGLINLNKTLSVCTKLVEEP